jgi:hypothetical protein
VRAEGPKLAESTGEPDIRRAALELVAHTEPDPLATWLLVLTGALLVILSAYWIAHGKPPHGSVPDARLAPRESVR